MVYSLNVWLPVYLVIALIYRHNGTLCQYDILIYCIISINAMSCHTDLFVLLLFEDT